MNINMAEHIKNHNGLKWVLLLSCLGINALSSHYLFTNDANLIFSGRSDQDDINTFFFNTFFATSILILSIYLSLKDLGISAKISCEILILILILINIVLISLNFFIMIVAISMSGPNGF